MSNPFGGGVAERYHFGRPRHHLRTLRRAPLRGPGIAIDVAGGTGLSTGALTELGYDAICFDVSLPMLHFAPPPKLAAAAERLPFRDACASVVSVSSAVHWFDQHAFYAEAGRVLTADGLLVLYEHGFLGTMVGRDDFSEWAWGAYNDRYPPPPRGKQAGKAVATGFAKLGEDHFTERIPFTLDALVAYHLTQSNTADPVERGDESLDDVRTWLRETLAPFFADADVGEFEFFGRIDWWSPTAS